MEYIYSRLWSRGGNDPNGDIDSSEKSELASKKEILSNCARNCKLDTITRRALGLITLPKGASGEFNGDRILIGIICVSMALRVILADPQFENPESLARGVRHPHLGIESLFKKLDAIKSLEEEKKKYSRYMFKLFYTAYTGRSKNISLTLPLRSLSLYFFCKSSLYTFPLYQGIIQSAIKTYENNSSGISEIYSFYSEYTLTQ